MFLLFEGARFDAATTVTGRDVDVTGTRQAAIVLDEAAVAAHASSATVPEG